MVGPLATTPGQPGVGMQRVGMTALRHRDSIEGSVEWRGSGSLIHPIPLPVGGPHPVFHAPDGLPARRQVYRSRRSLGSGWRSSSRSPVLRPEVTTRSLKRR
jgi:hypothetical protein